VGSIFSGQAYLCATIFIARNGLLFKNIKI